MAAWRPRSRRVPEARQRLQLTRVWPLLLAVALLINGQSPGEGAAPGNGAEAGSTGPSAVLTKLQALAKSAHEEVARLKEQRAELADQFVVPEAAQGFAPETPILPHQFRAKGKARMFYKHEGVRDLLVILHYDFPNRRTREDLYYIEPGKVERYYTGIRDYGKKKQTMIFHRVENPPIRTPHGCVVVPLRGDLFHPTLVDERGVWLGAKNRSVRLKVPRYVYAEKEGGGGHQNASGGQSNTGEDSSSRNATQHGTITVPTHHWYVPWNGETWDYFESAVSRKPVMLERRERNFNVTFLHFSEGAHTVPPDLFRADTITPLRCRPYGSRRRKGEGE